MAKLAVFGLNMCHCSEASMSWKPTFAAQWLNKQQKISSSFQIKRLPLHKNIAARQQVRMSPVLKYNLENGVPRHSECGLLKESSLLNGEHMCNVTLAKNVFNSLVKNSEDERNYQTYNLKVSRIHFLNPSWNCWLQNNNLQ